MQYRRVIVEGSTYFFTVNLANRSRPLLTDHINDLRHSIRYVRDAHPFHIIAMVVLPEHLHAIWQLPEGDGDFSTRWSLIKAGFSRSIRREEIITLSRARKRERGVWQRRFWEHQIRDEADLKAHIDYIHYNPVKHNLVSHVLDWRHSSFHRFVRHGILPANWAGG